MYIAVDHISHRGGVSTNLYCR